MDYNTVNTNTVSGNYKQSKKQTTVEHFCLMSVNKLLTALALSEIQQVIHYPAHKF